MSTPEPKKRGRHKTQRPKLSAADIHFCKLLMTGKSQYEAYGTAYGPKDTREATDMAASRRVRKREIRQYIRELQERAKTVAEVDFDRIVQALARIAFADRGELFDSKGRLLPKEKWPADVRDTVEGVETEEIYEVVSEKGQPRRKELQGHNRKVKTAARTPAMRLLCEILGYLGPRAEGRSQDGPPKPWVPGGDADPNAL